MGPYTSYNLLIISATRACRSRYQTRSAVALHKDYTIPSCNITSVWLCITLLTLKTHCLNETSPFWVGFPLKVLICGILPTTCEATLEQEISHCGSDVRQSNCILVPSTNTLPSLPTQCSPSPTIICLGVAMSQPVCTLWCNNISMDHNFCHIFFPSAKTNKVFLSSSLWTTISFTVKCSYTSPSIMSGFINT